VDADEAIASSTDTVSDPRAKAGLDSGQIEVRPVQRRQVFVGGVPVGDPFE
jgi:hypothetical protein